MLYRLYNENNEFIKHCMASTYDDAMSVLNPSSTDKIFAVDDDNHEIECGVAYVKDLLDQIEEGVKIDGLPEEYRQSFKRLFAGQDLEIAYCRFDGHTARNEFLRNGWNYAIDQGWLRVEKIELEQETFYKGFLTEKGKQEVIDL